MTFTITCAAWGACLFLSWGFVVVGAYSHSAAWFNAGIATQFAASSVAFVILLKDYLKEYKKG